jgi:hypothetical protein
MGFGPTGTPPIDRSRRGGREGFILLSCKGRGRRDSIFRQPAKKHKTEKWFPVKGSKDMAKAG